MDVKFKREAEKLQNKVWHLKMTERAKVENDKNVSCKAKSAAIFNGTQKVSEQLGMVSNGEQGQSTD